MRRRAIILLWLLIILLRPTALIGRAQPGTWPLQILEADEHHLLLELTLPAFETETITHDGIEYQRPRVVGWSYWGRPGQPQLPMYNIPVGMPWPGDPQITVLKAESDPLEGYHLYPMPDLSLGDTPPGLLGGEEAPDIVEVFAFDAETYNADTVYPGRLVEATDNGFLRDQPLFQLRLYPFQYNPRQGVLRVYRRLKVLVTFPSVPLSPAQAVTEPTPPPFEKILQRTLVNYDSLPRPTVAVPTSPRPPPAGELNALTVNATYVIITHPNFYDAAQGLASHRASRGESVAVVKTNDIYDQYNGGVKSPGAIRDFLVDAYANGSPKPVYVALVGDASANPDKLTDYLPAHYDPVPVFGNAPNDTWYAKVHGSDIYPDLFVGRIPARSASEVTTVVNKIQSYEGSPPAGDWPRRAVLVADDGDNAFRGDMETVAGLLPAGIAPIKIYNYDSDNTVEDQIGPGALLFAYSGHGNTTTWGYWGSHNIYRQSKISGMWNGNKLPFMTVANCSNGYFADPDNPRIMAEEFLLINDKGGIASWAPSSYAFPSVNTPMIVELYRTLFNDNDWILGSAVTAARLEAYLANDHLPLALFEVFTYFGDPALRLNVTDAPIAGLSADNDSPTQLGSATTLSATVTSGTNVVYTWDFSDGSSPESDSPIQHTYPATGTYTAHVTATNGVGGQSGATSVTITDVPPTASFTSSTPDLLGQTTTFHSTSTGTNLVYQWDFGDESPPASSQASTITHTYVATGTYSVVLTASNSMDSSTVTGLVEIVDTLPVYLPSLFK
jgi:hypothetical protein